MHDRSHTTSISCFMMSSRRPSGFLCRSLTSFRTLLSFVVWAVVVMLLFITSPTTERMRQIVRADPSRRSVICILPQCQPGDFNDAPVERIFPPDRPFVFYTISYHASPVGDLIHLLGPLGVRFIEKGPNSYGCEFFNSCRTAEVLKAVGDTVGWYMNETRIAQFYEAYKDDEEMKNVDAFLCMHPAAACELFIAFNKPIVIVTSIRYDSGRFIGSQWIAWHHNFAKIVSNPNNIIAANNLYDVNFIRYYMGINVHPQLLPSYCGYTRQRYTPSRPGFLLGMRRDKSFQNFFLTEFYNASRQMNVSVSLRPIYDVYSRYQWSDLAAHQGIVNLPVQPSVMAIFEQYRMNIPLFFPSKRLMLDWEMSGHMMTDEIQTPHRETNGFRMPGHPSSKNIKDPTERDRESAAYWNEFCDWYNMPHIVYYDSIRELVLRLSEITQSELLEISQSMSEYNRRLKNELLAIWRRNLRRISDISRRTQPEKPAGVTINSLATARRLLRPTPPANFTRTAMLSTLSIPSPK